MIGLNKNTALSAKQAASGILLMLSGYVLSGCSAVQPFPAAARAGDTVMLAVGSPDGMNKTNTMAQYAPDSDPLNAVDLTPGIRSIFKLYPDQTSEAWLADTFADGVPIDTTHGPWLTIVAIDLPLTLFPGTGNVQITTSATIGSFATPINGLDIPLEVLDGAGQPAQFPYEALSATLNGDLSKLEPLPQVVVRPPLGDTTPTYGAIEVRLNVPIINNDLTAAPDAAYTVVVDDMARTHQNSQLQTVWARNGDEITVMFVSPNGAMRAWEARFSVVIFPSTNGLLGIPGSMIDPAKPSPSLVSIKYYDVNGVEVTGPSPAVVVEGS